MYALFKDGKQVSKGHSTTEAVFTEAFEIGAMVNMPRISPAILSDGYSVAPIGPKPSKPKPSDKGTKP